MNGTTATVWSICKIFELKPTYILPVGGWFPYDYEKPIIYWLTSVSQILAPIMAANITGKLNHFSKIIRLCKYK